MTLNVPLRKVYVGGIAKTVSLCMAQKGIFLSSSREWNMADDHTPQHEPGEEVSPAFLCPACGYLCATSWEARAANAARAIFYERGKVLVAIARMMPLQTVCIHPDGTSRYGGADTANTQERVTQRLVTPEEAEEMRADVPPLADILAPKDIEDALLLALAGPLAENLCCSVSPQDYPQEFAYAYDWLLDLPETSLLVAHDNDLRLTAIQDLIINLLNAADEDLSIALLEALEQRHVLTPADLEALLEAHAPGDEEDEDEG